MEPWMIGILVPLGVFSIPIVAIITSHQQKMAEIKARIANGLSEEVRAELNEIKTQIATLRDTTTRFDMTFDAALTRLEERMDHVEQQRPVTSSTAVSSSSSEATVTARRGGG